ncbi:hypothetical protein ES703_99521 [subsurface metagenome]
MDYPLQVVTLAPLYLNYTIVTVLSLHNFRRGCLATYPPDSSLLKEKDYLDN